MRHHVRSYGLWSGSVLRLAFSVILFWSYGGTAIYFNHYVHQVNSEAVEMFFALHNRAIYTTAGIMFIKEALATGNKLLVSNNPS